MGLGFWVVGFWAWFSGFGLRCRARGVGCGGSWALGTRDSVNSDLRQSPGRLSKMEFQEVLVLLEDYHGPLRIGNAHTDKDQQSLMPLKNNS